MDPLTHESARSLRYTVYSLLIVVSVGCMVGRIWTVRSDRGKTPFLSANDRSRWATIRALVELPHVQHRSSQFWSYGAAASRLVHD